MSDSHMMAECFLYDKTFLQLCNISAQEMCRGCLSSYIAA